MSNELYQQVEQAGEELYSAINKLYIATGSMKLHMENETYSPASVFNQIDQETGRVMRATGAVEALYNVAQKSELDLDQFNETLCSMAVWIKSRHKA